MFSGVFTQFITNQCLWKCFFREFPVLNGTETDRQTDSGKQGDEEKGIVDE